MIWKNKVSIIFISVIAIFFAFLDLTLANSIALGHEQDFFIDPGFDLSKRKEITGSLQLIGKNAYFYIDLQWLNALNAQEKKIVRQALQNLDLEFSQKIYPELTSVFGYESKPGIDNNEQITILIHPMNKAAGYVRTADGHFKVEVPNSNQREMIYLCSDFIHTSFAPSYLAREFMHLITLNQKNQPGIYR